MGYASGPAVYARVIPTEHDLTALKKEAVEVAKNADIVLFIGGLNKNHLQDCEGGDRQSFSLPFGQNELIKEILEVNKNLGVILVSGNAVEMPWIKNVKAVLQSWYLGSMAGDIIASVISGDTNPSGKLPFSFPKKLLDNAAHHFGRASYPGDSINQYYKEDILVGYRWHDTKKIPPLFAFGYGLSYSSFKISEISVKKSVYTSDDIIDISCLVTNTGKRKGAEVVQVYVGMKNSKITRAQKELKAFKKVYLEPGEFSAVNIQIPIKDLMYYSEQKSSWELETGTYVFYIGNASNNIRKKLEIAIKL